MESIRHTQKPRVALATGDTREETVARALDLVRDDILAKVSGQVMIKPNLLSSVNELASTQAGAVRPVLELLRDSGYDMGDVFIAEGASRSCRQAYDNFGYRGLERDFDVELVDLNRDAYNREIELVTETCGLHSIAYSEITGSVDTSISVAVAKTHDIAVMTGAVKNMMGCLRRVQRPRMHGIQLGRTAECGGELLWNVVEDHSWIIKAMAAVVFRLVHIRRKIEKLTHKGAQPGLLSQARAITENLYRMSRVLMPDVAVVDGFRCMEGQGPGGGSPVEMKVAVAGTDPVACDTVMASLMGFDPLSIGYLALAHEHGLGCAKLSGIDIVGESPGRFTRSFVPHVNYPVQIRWREAWPGERVKA